MLKKHFSLLCAVLLLLSLCCSASAQAEEITLWQGESTVENVWTVSENAVFTTNAGGSFYMGDVRPGGCFIVTASQPDIYLAYNEWSGGIWAQWYPDRSDLNENGDYECVFSYEGGLAAYTAAGGKDLTCVQAIHMAAANTAPVTFRSLIWQPAIKDPAAENGGEENTVMDQEIITLFAGAAYSEQKDASLMYNIFTKHAGGNFDTARMNEGCAFTMTYTGEKNGLSLTLISHSGGNRWARMTASEVTENEDGSFTALYDYNTIVRTYGTNFVRLDEIRAVSNTAARMTCRKIQYIPGEGAVADTSDGKWSRPSTGIAFIGDSITQNVLANEGDFNTLLGRNDCVNFGIGGQTSRHLAARIDEVADRDFSRLVIWCGINDIGAGISADETFNNIKSMIAACREKNEGMTFVIISVLPTTPAFYTREQDKIVARNDLLRAFADENDDVTFVDAYSAFVGEDGYCRDGLTLDGLHPNHAGYLLVKERLAPVLAD